MFPEIVREDVFRLETRRLWLRWPEPGDAVPDMASDLPEAATGDPYSALPAAAVEANRAANASGSALYLVLTGRGADRAMLGRIALVPIRDRIENCGLKLEGSLAPRARGDGLMTEAVQALVDTAFMLTETPLVAASSKVRDPGFRRVLEKCGFSYCGTGLDAPRSGSGLIACDRFRLDRKAWASLKAWRVPGVVHARTGPADRGGCQPDA